MSVPKEKLLELVNNLNNDDIEKVFDFVSHLASKDQKLNKTFDASKYFGIYKDLAINIDQEAGELRKEWDRDF